VIYVNSQAVKTLKHDYLLNKLLCIPLRNSYNCRLDFYYAIIRLFQRRWKEYFESVLTADPEDTDNMIFFTAENEDRQPRYEEVTHIIKYLKNHKMPGTDQILAELLKKEEKPYGEESTILLN
jgi:hypothetical protein